MLRSYIVLCAAFASAFAMEDQALLQYKQDPAADTAPVMAHLKDDSCTGAGCKPKTTETTTTTTLGIRGKFGDCLFFGDPHFVTFDGQHIYYHGQRDVYLVKSSRVIVQGRGLTKGGDMMGVAISGPFINNNVLTFINKGYDNGKDLGCEVRFNKKVVAEKYPSKFASDDGTVEVRYDLDITLTKEETNRLKDTTEHKNFKKAFNGPKRRKTWLIRLGSGEEQMEVILTAHDFTTGVLTMRSLKDQDGWCGNFDGDAENDQRKFMLPRGAGYPPTVGLNLFGSNAEYEKYSNCKDKVPTDEKRVIAKTNDVPLGDKEACYKYCAKFTTVVHFDFAQVLGKGKKTYDICRCWGAVPGGLGKNPKQKRIMCTLAGEKTQESFGQSHECNAEEKQEAQAACAAITTIIKPKESEDSCIDQEFIDDMVFACEDDFCQNGDPDDAIDAVDMVIDVETACRQTDTGKKWDKLKTLLKSAK